MEQSVSENYEADVNLDATEEVDPVEEFKLSLLTKPGEWFVIHSYAGYEKRVKLNLENRIKTLHMEDFIYEVAVPNQDETEVKNGQKKTVQKNKFPGYVLVRMDMSHADAWGTVRHTPGDLGSTT
jgi:transcription termination/antitermination protein NusG